MSIFDELEKLQSLRNRGVITDDQYERGKTRILSKSASTSQRTSSSWLQNFRRSRSDRLLGGICGALSGVMGLPSWVWRFIFCFIFAIHWIAGLVYLLLWMFVSPEPKS